MHALPIIRKRTRRLTTTTTTLSCVELSTPFPPLPLCVSVSLSLVVMYSCSGVLVRVVVSCLCCVWFCVLCARSHGGRRGWSFHPPAIPRGMVIWSSYGHHIYSTALATHPGIAAVQNLGHACVRVLAPVVAAAADARRVESTSACSALDGSNKSDSMGSTGLGQAVVGGSMRSSTSFDPTSGGPGSSSLISYQTRRGTGAFPYNPQCANINRM